MSDVQGERPNIVRAVLEKSLRDKKNRHDDLTQRIASLELSLREAQESLVRNNGFIEDLTAALEKL